MKTNTLKIAEQYLASIHRDNKSLFEQMLSDQINFGRSGYVVSEKGQIRSLTFDELMSGKIADFGDITYVENLTAAEIIEKYKDILTPEDIKNLDGSQNKL